MRSKSGKVGVLRKVSEGVGGGPECPLVKAAGKPRV